MTIRSIYARSLNHVIGNNGKLPWKIDGDLPRFKDLTLGQIVIMGYNTWLSLPKRPLPQRYNIVLTKSHFEECINNPEEAAKAVFAKEMSEAILYAQTLADNRQLDIWIIGGAEIYRQAEPYIDEVYETVVLCNQVQGDTFYHHHGKRELVSEERTIAEVNGSAFDAVHRIFKIKRE